MKLLTKSLIARKSIEQRFISHIFKFYHNNNNQNDNRKTTSRNYVGGLTKGLLIGSASLLAYQFYDNLFVYAKEPTENNHDVGKVRDNLPFYTMEEVSKHTNKDQRIWVTYKEGVYDITDFVVGHPGGEQILMAAGNSVEPFWVLYAVHNNPHVYEILKTLRIGNLSKEDSLRNAENAVDPYSSDPKRHPVLIPASIKPFNAESPPYFLVENFLTPNEFFYVRNHLPVPEIDIDAYELEIEIEATGKTLKFTYDQLKKMPKQTITATIMCGGNRRSEMTQIKAVKGLNWGPAAVGNATWTGVRLSDLLKMAGVNEDDRHSKHVQFEGIDVDATGKTYGASIPFWKAIEKRGDVILAYEMNGVPIPRDHGFPIRVIVPGTVGARNVKWLGRIVVSDKESDSHWQQNDYKGFSPSTDWDTVDFSKAPAIQELPVISAICKPQHGESVKIEDGHVVVKGYAWSGGGQRIVRVDVTADGGKSWHVADLNQTQDEPPQHWSWTLWTVKIPVDPKRTNMEIWAKAVDSCYNTQPESFENIWNLRGVLSNAYHRITIKLQ